MLAEELQSELDKLARLRREGNAHSEGGLHSESRQSFDAAVVGAENLLARLLPGSPSDPGECERSVGASPRSAVSPATQTRRALANALKGRANAYVKLRQYERAEPDFRAALAIACMPDQTGHDHLEALIESGLGTLASRRGQHEDALAAYQRAWAVASELRQGGASSAGTPPVAVAASDPIAASDKSHTVATTVDAQASSLAAGAVCPSPAWSAPPAWATVVSAQVDTFAEQALVNCGIPLRALGRTQEAVEAYELVLATPGFGEHAETPQVQARVQVSCRATIQLGICLLQLGQHARALSTLASAVRLAKRSNSLSLVAQTSAAQQNMLRMFRWAPAAANHPMDTEPKDTEHHMDTEPPHCHPACDGPPEAMASQLEIDGWCQLADAALTDLVDAMRAMGRQGLDTVTCSICCSAYSRRGVGAMHVLPSCYHALCLSCFALSAQASGKRCPTCRV
jgi:tetratricopeptide (TPR) repeat protein